MVAIEHRTKSTKTLLSPSSASTSSQSTASVSTSTAKSTSALPTSNISKAKDFVSTISVSKSVVKISTKDATAQELQKRKMKLDLTTGSCSSKDLQESVKSPKSPIVGRLPQQTSLVSNVDVEDRKSLREALYQGIFSRHRRTIFAVGSFLRMLRSRNSQYNTIRSTSEGDEEVKS